MATRRPPRLHPTIYVGINRYSLTICAHRRRPLLTSPPCFEVVRRQLLQSAAHHGFSLLAYCAMPDHLHVLAEALDDRSDLRVFAWDFKRRAGFAFKRATGEPLWQEGFYDRVLRSDESSRTVARYLLENPVRAGLARHPLEWPFLGSERYALTTLLDGVGDSRV
jgi:REP element-mobilizing transposase RayT